MRVVTSIPTGPEDVMAKARELARDFIVNVAVKHRNLSQRHNELDELAKRFFIAINEGMTMTREPVRNPSDIWEAVMKDRQATIELVRTACMRELYEPSVLNNPIKHKAMSELFLIVIGEIEARKEANVFSNLLNIGSTGELK
jgi:hypothetical protein